MLGYEEPDDDPDVCIKPPFRPWKQWSETGSKAYRDLAATFSESLYVGQPYATGPVDLEPKRERFVGFSGRTG